MGGSSEQRYSEWVTPTERTELVSPAVPRGKRLNCLDCKITLNFYIFIYILQSVLYKKWTGDQRYSLVLKETFNEGFLVHLPLPGLQDVCSHTRLR